MQARSSPALLPHAMMQAEALLDTPIARYVWESRYRAQGETSIEATWQRVARRLAGAEPAAVSRWYQRFLDLMRDFQFLPGGRILAGSGINRDVTLFNCFVMGAIEDSMPGIFRALSEGAVTMQQGGGVGYDFSTLRPKGAEARSVGAIASGPVSFMSVWDAMCATVQSTASRRGAMIATLHCDHPDIMAFIEAKHNANQLHCFNPSVQVTDAFMQAIARDESWPLLFPASRLASDGETLLRECPGESGAVPCRVVRRMPARTLWDTLLHASYDSGEPGVLFIDRINHENNLLQRPKETTELAWPQPPMSGDFETGPSASTAWSTSARCRFTVARDDSVGSAARRHVTTSSLSPTFAAHRV